MIVNQMSCWRLGPEVQTLEKETSVEGILEVGPPEPADGFPVDGKKRRTQDDCQISWVDGDARY